jgi:hypothetical protein
MIKLERENKRRKEKINDKNKNKETWIKETKI